VSVHTEQTLENHLTAIRSNHAKNNGENEQVSVGSTLAVQHATRLPLIRTLVRLAFDVALLTLTVAWKFLGNDVPSWRGKTCSSLSWLSTQLMR
jgi:hypothetical protein